MNFVFLREKRPLPDQREKKGKHTGSFHPNASDEFYNFTRDYIMMRRAASAPVFSATQVRKEQIRERRKKFKLIAFPFAAAMA